LFPPTAEACGFPHLKGEIYELTDLERYLAWDVDIEELWREVKEKA